MDADAGAGWPGGTLVAGTYDAVKAEWNGSLEYSHQETLVLDGNGRFTRSRLVKTGPNSTAVINYRSGTYATSVSGGSSYITFTDECAARAEGDAGLDAVTVGYEVVTDECGRSMIRYGASGIRVTLQQH